SDKTLIQSVTLFDLFEGGTLGAGKKSLAFSVTLQAADHTLTEQEIAAVSDKIVAAVTKATAGTLRTSPLQDSDSIPGLTQFIFHSSDGAGAARFAASAVPCFRHFSAVSIRHENAFFQSGAIHVGSPILCPARRRPVRRGCLAGGSHFDAAETHEAG